MSDHFPAPSQAEAMMRRVSPEGRARALVAQQRRQRAQRRLVLRVAAATMALLVLAAVVNGVMGPIGAPGVIAVLVAIIVAAVAIGFASRERPASAAALTATDLHLLPQQTAAWLEAQRPALPAPAARLVDAIGVRLDAMAPQLAALDPREPAADAVRKLLSTELPGLLDRYASVPPTLRTQAQGDGRSPDAHLLHGLGVIDGEIARMTEQLACGAFDELATQHRYLELKYDGAAPLG